MKNYLEYKGYISVPKFSLEDNLFYGRIEGINDLVSFQGNSVEELKTSFKVSIDDYLATCKEIGKEPDKAFKGVFNVRVSSSKHKKLSFLATKKGVNLNELCNRSFDYILKHQEVL